MATTNKTIIKRGIIMSTKLETELFNELVELYKKTRTELYNPATFWVALGQR